MTELYLLRHGETEWSRDGKHTSYTDLALTDHGTAQAQAAADKVAGLHIDQVWVSPLRRARDTAKLAGLATPEIIDDLTEWNYGEYEGLTSPEIRRRDPQWLIWTGPTPGGESPQEVRLRCERLIARAESSPAQRIAMVAHGHILRALSLVWLDLDLSVGERFPLDTGSLSILGSYHGQRALLGWNI